MPTLPLAPGTVLGGRFLLDTPLGRGGTAVVYRGRDQTLRVPRAIKVLEAGWTTGRMQLRKRLRDEARVMARIRHPHVLNVYDVIEDGDLDFVVMDLAAGGSLSQRMERDGVIPPEEAVDILIEVLGALTIAHQHGVIHRDVKPQNILLDEQGHTLLADFGIALLSLDEATRSTRSGVAMGSLAYMAPEQRVDARTVTATADVYSAGATLFHLVTGANPVDLFMAGIESTRVAEVPAPLRRVIVRATRYEPDRRYSSAPEMIADLERARAELGAPAPPAPAARRWWRGVGVGMVLLVAAIGGRWWSLVSDVPPPAPPPAPVVADRRPLPVEEPTSDASVETAVSAPTSRPVVAARPIPSAAVVAPAPVVEPLPEPSALADAPFGVWRGSINGLVTTFRLSGTDDRVTGSVTTTRGGASLSFDVEGRFDRSGQSLVLNDRVDGPDAGVYTVMFDPTLRRFSGTFVRTSDGTRVVVQGFR